MTTYIKADWPLADIIRACSTTRRDPNNDFNLAAHVGDDHIKVDANRKILCEELEINMPHWLTQTHSNIVINLDENTSTNPNGDAAITRQPGKVCAVMTADCLPILLASRQGGAIAAVHAGWRGLYQDIISNTVKAMQTPGQEIFAWLGPAISQKNYIVSKTLHDDFLHMNLKFADAFVQHQGNWHMDLYQIARIQLQNLGITRIYGGHHCTYEQQGLFYSYRRDGSRTGRLATLIWRV